MLTGGRGVHKNLTFADGGEGGGAQNGQKNADIINERPLNVQTTEKIAKMKD